MTKAKSKKVEEIIEEVPLHTSIEPLKDEMPEILKKHVLNVKLTLGADVEWWFKEPAEDGHLYPAYSFPKPDHALIFMCMAASKNQGIDTFIHECIQHHLSEQAAKAAETTEAPQEN